MDITADSPSLNDWPRTASPSLVAITVAGNEDILIEILVRVPAKSLIRFKTVCKYWFSLISGRQFSLIHTLRNPRAKLSGLILRKIRTVLPIASASGQEFEFVPLDSSLSRSPPFRSLDFIRSDSSNQTPNSGIKILQSCNGLLICCSYPQTTGNLRNYYVANPTTKESIELDPPGSAASATIIGLSLAFDPSKSPHYKVVCVRSTVSSMYSYQIEIYSSENRLWRVSGENFTAPFDMVFTDGVFWNGGIHWISPSGAAMAFLVDSERLETIPAIPVLRRDWGRRYRYFGESDGHLHLIEVHGPHTSQLHIFELERDYSKWYLRYTVDLEEIVAAYPFVRRHGERIERATHAFSILSVFHGDDEDDSALVLNVPCKVISCNLKYGFFKELLDFTPREGDRTTMLQFGCFDTYQYAETLVPV